MKNIKKLLIIIVLVSLMIPLVSGFYFSDTYTPKYYMALNETSGINVAEGMTGTSVIKAQGPSWTADGYFANAYHATETQFINMTGVTDMGLLGIDVTIAMMVKLNSTQDDSEFYDSAGRTIMGVNAYSTGTTCSPSTNMLTAKIIDAPNTGNYYTCSNVTAPLQTWFRIVFVVDSTNDRQYLYVNGTLVGNSSHTQDKDEYGAGNRHIGLGANAFQNINHMNGTIDEVMIYDGVWTQENITLDWAFFAPSVPPVTYSTSLVLTGLNDKQINYADGINESTPFFISGNYTADGISIDGGECNFTGYNISAHFDTTGENFTLNSTSQLDLNISEGVTNLKYDIAEFAICRENLKSGVEIYFNGTLHSTIDQNIIPLCSIGLHHEIIDTTSWTDTRSVNLSVQCPGCTTINRNMRIVKQEHGNHDYLLSLKRAYSEHSEDLTFNPTSSLYEDTSHSYDYDIATDGNITIDCNGTQTFTTFPIIGAVPEISILAIRDEAFSSGMLIQANETTDILIEVTGDISVISFNVTGINGNIIKTTDTELLSMDSTDLNESNIYNITIFAENQDGNFSSLQDYFVYNDTVRPSITFNYPTDLMNIEIDSSERLNITVFDVNLFYYNITIIDSEDVTVLFNETTDLNSSSYLIDNLITFNKTGIWTITVWAKDDHTKELIQDYDISKSSDYIQFENVKISANYSINADYEKFHYRYSFTFDYPKGIDEKIFYVECPEKLYYQADSRYKAHFVCQDKWIDFEGIEENPIIEMISDNKFMVVFDSPLDDRITFNSIGSINTYGAVISVNVISDNPYNYNLIEDTNWFNREAIDTTSISGVLVLFFLFGILIFLVMTSVMTRIPVLFFLAGLYSLFLGFLMFVVLSVIVGVIISIFGAVFIIWGVMASSK